MKFLLLILTGFAISANAAVEDSDFDSIFNADQAQTIICEEDTPIQNHMSNLAELIDSLMGDVDLFVYKFPSEEDRKRVLATSQSLKLHLLAVLPKTPEKLKAIDPNNRMKAQLYFQQYLTRVLALTIQLDLQLVDNTIDIDPSDMRDRRIRIQNLIVQINDTIVEAHSRFRD